MKKMKIILTATTTALLFLGCSSLTNKMSIDQYTSFKGITRSIAQESPAAIPVADPYMIPLKDGQFFDCRAIKSREYVLNGQKYTKFVLNDDKALRCPNVSSFKTDMIWKVKKTSWAVEDEQKYSEFIKKLGYSKCQNLDACLSSEASNMLISEEDMQNMYYSDCADLPYYLRAYFAYKNNLPFSFVSQFVPVPLTELQIATDEKYKQTLLDTKGVDGPAAVAKYEANINDNRYSRNGNIPTSRVNVPSSTGVTRSFSRIGLIINDAISSGTFRTLSGDKETGALSDFYSPKINGDYVKSGTPVYGTKGHAAIVYDVKPNGELLIMDGHPGNSISYKGWITDEFVMDRASHGGMFKNFRPLRIESPKFDKKDPSVIISGQTRFATDEELPGYSLEQYDSNNFTQDGKNISLQEWTQLRLSGGKYRIEPMYEIKTATDILCDSAKGRAQDVQDAFDNGVATSEHINVLPDNIFAAVDAWETYSTPSRDLRLRNDAVGIVSLAKTMLERFNNKDPMISYNGQNLKADLVKAFTTAANKCAIIYKNSNAQPVTISLLRFLKRLPFISFDPFMCPEVRWGSTSPTELATCKDGADKKDWQRYTQFLRNNLVKDTTANHGFTLDQLKTMDANKQIDNNPLKINYDIGLLIQGL